MGKIYMKTDVRSTTFIPEISEPVTGKYIFSFFRSKPKGVSIEIPVPQEASQALEKIRDLPTEYLGYAELYAHSQEKRLFFHGFHPFFNINQRDRPSGGVATSAMLAVLRELQRKHPGATMHFSDEVTPSGRIMWGKFGVDTSKQLSIEDLHAKVKRYHENPKLREIMGRKIRREIPQ